jgi:hypothetical protein
VPAVLAREGDMLVNGHAAPLVREGVRALAELRAQTTAG